MVSWAAALELKAITLPDALRLLLLVRDSDLARYELALAALGAIGGAGSEPGASP